MKIIGYILAALAVLVITVFVVGALLPKAHVAAVRARYKAPPESVYAAILDVERATRWRSGLQKVEVLQLNPFRWRETADWGTITFEREEARAPSLIATRIADEDQGFGGTWTYRIEPTDSTTMLTIIENGTVSNPLFRFMSRFVFGHYSSLETYARDLGKHFGETTEVERLNSADPAH